jgi:hypothetical protein
VQYDTAANVYNAVMRPQSGESGRGSVIDFALILILFSIVLVVIVVLLGPRITEFLSSLVP